MTFQEFFLIATLVVWWHVVKWLTFIVALTVCGKALERGLANATSKGKRSTKPMSADNTTRREV